MLTKGFNQGDRFRHFKKHVLRRANISAADEISYEAMADNFLGQSRQPSMFECTRAGGDRIRFDCKTDEYGICDSGGFIRTYFKPEAAVHGLPTNFHYMCQECRTVFPPNGVKQVI